MIKSFKGRSIFNVFICLRDVSPPHYEALKWRVNQIFNSLLNESQKIIILIHIIIIIIIIIIICFRFYSTNDWRDCCIMTLDLIATLSCADVLSLFRQTKNRLKCIERQSTHLLMSFTVYDRIYYYWDQKYISCRIPHCFEISQCCNFPIT
jgi:hypothetical protein